MPYNTPEKARAWRDANRDKVREYNRRDYQKNREAHNARSERARKKRLYGITQEQYDGMLAERDGRCDLCGEQRKLDVDHDHETNRIRGMLCRPCNTALGRLGDSAEGLRKALTYVEGV